MAPNRNQSRSNGNRSTGRPIRDARDVLRRKTGPAATRATNGGVSKRILRTSQGLVTNKKSRGISTAQLRNRQSEQRNAVTTKPRNNASAPPAMRGVGVVKAAMKRSAIINSNPVLQHAILDIAGALTARRRNTANTGRPSRIAQPSIRERNVMSSVSYSRIPVTQYQRPIPAHLQSRLDRRSDAPCSVLVSNLHANVSEADIQELFRSIGPIVTAMFVSPGNALITYHQKSSAIKAVETYHLRLLDGQPMTCVLLTPDMVPVKEQPVVPER